jgi:NAD(P)-dependent dehydrogenase (short-subunit alcohol dehydrogenase family)
MWTKDNIPQQQGKTVLITGANAGLGYEDALAFYEKGAHVIVACRDAAKAAQTIERLKPAGGTGSLEPGILDLSSLDSVKAFAEQILKAHQQIDILINNAGVMMTPRSATKEGFELQFGVNFIGHFALTALLYPILKGRVVTLSSGAHKWAPEIDYTNLRLEKSYDPRSAYAVSKLADLIFTIELQRRAGDQLLSLGAHPGITRTELQRHLENAEELMAHYPVIMDPWQGALPTLYAATSPDVRPAGYYGPDGDKELVGYPAPAVISDAASDPAAGAALWKYAVAVTGIPFLANYHPKY